MAYHEAHERSCPHCGERMSATAPRCLNCGRYVDEEEDDDDSPARTQRTWLVVAGVVAAAIVFGVVVVSFG